MYPQYDTLPDRILRSVNPPSHSPSPFPFSSPSSPSLGPSATPDGTHPRSINAHIATYLRNPTPTWLAVQQAKAAGAQNLVYYYEPSDRYVHFAATGLPEHDCHYFDGEAGFYLGDEGIEGIEGDGGVGDGLGGGGEICGGGDGAGDGSGGKEGGEGLMGLAGREGDGDEMCAEAESDVWSGYDCEWDLYQPFGMVERPVAEFMAGKGDGVISVRDVNASSGAEEGMSGFGDWHDAWDEFFK